MDCHYGFRKLGGKQSDVPEAQVKNLFSDFRSHISNPKDPSADFNSLCSQGLLVSNFKIQSPISLGWRQADYRIPNSNPKSQGVPL